MNFASSRRVNTIVLGLRIGPVCSLGTEISFPALSRHIRCIVVQAELPSFARSAVGTATDPLVRAVGPRETGLPVDTCAFRAVEAWKGRAHLCKWGSAQMDDELPAEENGFPVWLVEYHKLVLTTPV